MSSRYHDENGNLRPPKWVGDNLKLRFWVFIVLIVLKFLADGTLM